MNRNLPPALVLRYPHPILDEVISVNVVPVPQELLDRLFCTMYHYRGLGLAANQIGEKRRVFVMRVPNGIERVFINPRVTARSDDTKVETEGCLSLPGQFYPVDRHLTMDLTCNNQGKLYTISLEGLEARVAQHEMDHLNGIILSRGNDVRLL